MNALNWLSTPATGKDQTGKDSNASLYFIPQVEVCDYSLALKRRYGSKQYRLPFSTRATKGMSVIAGG